jgi:hypothetical protein
MEIEAEIDEAGTEQLKHLTDLDDTWHEHSNAKTLYPDGDLTLAAYAAAQEQYSISSVIQVDCAILYSPFERQSSNKFIIFAVRPLAPNYVGPVATGPTETATGPTETSPPQRRIWAGWDRGGDRSQLDGHSA